MVSTSSAIPRRTVSPVQAVVGSRVKTGSRSASRSSRSRTSVDLPVPSIPSIVIRATRPS